MPTDAARSSRPLLVPAVAAIGAGSVHAVAAGAHSDHRQAIWLFAALAMTQIGWGVLALLRPDRGVAGFGIVLSAAAIAGWVAAKTSGIGAIEGMATAEPVQTADVLAAALAMVTLLGCAAWFAGRLPAAPPVGTLLAVAVVAATLPAMVTAAVHEHDDGHAHDGEMAAGHDDGHADLVSDDHPVEPDVDARPFDPDLPIRLGGMPGTTPEQVAEAERLVAITLERLPRFAGVEVAIAEGYRSIGDGFTGHEHFVNWGYLDDGRILDPDHPESLVYRVEGGQRTLVAAMYMLEAGSTFDDVPDIGGPLVQWHIHEDLCYTDDPEAPQVRGLTNPDGTCSPPLVEGPRVPMVHVWIAPHPCGPFASLEGVAGGQIPEGEERLCDHVHGSH